MHHMAKYYALLHEIFGFIYTSNRPVCCTHFYKFFFSFVNYYYYYFIIIVAVMQGNS